MFTPEHWFQFADDAAVITNGEKENQLLLNSFTRWCQWSSMIIRVDKCTTFGIKKFSTRSLQYQPKLFIYNEIVPPVITGESFKYLLSNQEHMSKLSSIFTELLTQIYSLPLHPKNKLLLYNSYLLSQVSWHLTVADLSKTWIVKNLDNQVSIDISENHLRFMISKLSNLTIRTTYYIFCRRNKSWNNPELLQF